MANGRQSLELNDVHKIAKGRVWTAEKALDHELIDEIGTINDAISFAAKEVSLKEINIKILELPKTSELSKYWTFGNIELSQTPNFLNLRTFRILESPKSWHIPTLEHSESWCVQNLGTLSIFDLSQTPIFSEPASFRNLGTVSSLEHSESWITQTLGTAATWLPRAAPIV